MGSELGGADGTFVGIPLGFKVGMILGIAVGEIEG